MRRIRAYRRLLLFYLLTSATYLCRLMGKAIRPFSPRAAMRYRQRVFQRWARCLAGIIGMNVEVRGRPPRPPFFLVSNHLSYMDIAVLARVLEGVFVAKSDVKTWSFLGPIVAAFDTVFIDRSRKMDLPGANRAIESVLARGEGVVIFAEGTSSNGRNVLPIKSSLLSYPAERGFPVSVASISYRTPARETPAENAVCWWGEMTFMKHLLDLLAIPEFHATLTFGEAGVIASDRKVLAQLVHRSITGIFEPVAR